MFIHNSPRSSYVRGFSLLEMTVAFGISGILLSGIWQLTSAIGQQREVAAISSQAAAITAATQNYISAKRTTLLALTQLATLDSVARIKITSADTGVTSDNVQGAGYLPGGFLNSNSYGQSYALFVQRQDSGTIGVADSNDKLVGLLVTYSGSVISDQEGANIASAIGAAGGFVYSTNTAVAQGTNGGWSVDFTATGWSGMGLTIGAGHIAVYINLLPSNGAGLSVGPSSLNELDDAATDYSTLYNVYAGQGAGESNVFGSNNSALGYNALQKSVPAAVTSNNTALGYYALRGSIISPPVTGINNVAVGAYALENFVAASRNTAIGVEADKNNQNDNERTIIGYRAGLNCTGSNVTFVGAFTGACEAGAVGTVGSTLIGAQTGRNSAGAYNALAGAYIGSTSGQTGNYNSAVGYQALTNITSAGEYNTVLGYQAGANITDGDYNIIIGTGVTAPSATGNYQLNIGNLIYGDMTTKQVNIGSATMVSGISLDIGTRTDSARLAVGTTAQRPSCNAALVGAQRWNTTDATVEFCDGSSWFRPPMAYSGGTAPTAPLNPGYIVMTQGEWDGNLGSISGANDKCFSDLSANDWMGKAAASAAGQLITSNVKAFICGPGGGSCNTATPFSTYYFARSGSPSSGGASFSTDAYGGGPRNNVNWAGSNYFNSAVEFWSNRPSSSSTQWANGDAAWAYAGGDACAYWTSNSSSKFAIFGSPSNSDNWRWGSGGYGYGRTCDQMLRLVCFVHP